MCVVLENKIEVLTSILSSSSSKTMLKRKKMYSLKQMELFEFIYLHFARILVLDRYFQVKKLYILLYDQEILWNISCRVGLHLDWPDRTENVFATRWSDGKVLIQSVKYKFVTQLYLSYSYIGLDQVGSIWIRLSDSTKNKNKSILYIIAHFENLNKLKYVVTVIEIWLTLYGHEM